MELIVGKHYKITEKIASGAFGEVFKGIWEKNNKEVAIKLEPHTSKHPQLLQECKLYFQLLKGSEINKCIPNIYYCASEGDYNVMVMDLLGPSLEELFFLCNKKLSVKTVVMAADQLIQRIQFIHQKNYIHRDIKPNNFLIGIGRNSHKIYTIDFGLAKKYITAEGKHIDYKEGKTLTGTARYASINSHQGAQQSRRDDLESLGYMLLYFIRGSLPWQNIVAHDKKEKYQYILEKKLESSIEMLCKGFPQEFVTYMLYVKNLRFEEVPDYQYLRKLFKDLFKKSGYEHDYIYDWSIMVQTHEQKLESSLQKQKETKKLQKSSKDTKIVFKI